MMASHNTLQKNSSKRYQILCQHKTEVHYECLFLFKKVYQYAICTLKQDFCLRGSLLSCQFFLLFRDYKGKCQQHLTTVTHSSLQPMWYWLFLTFALTCHQKLGRNSFPTTVKKGLSPKFGWGWGRKHMKEGQVWIYQLAFWNNPGTLFLNKTGLRENHILLLWIGFRKVLLTSTTQLFVIKPFFCLFYFDTTGI